MNRWVLIALIPFLAQAIVISVDESVIHNRRDLPRWERSGHPLDTLSVLVVNALAATFVFSENALLVSIS